MRYLDIHGDEQLDALDSQKADVVGTLSHFRVGPRPDYVLNHGAPDARRSQIIVRSACTASRPQRSIDLHKTA